MTTIFSLILSLITISTTLISCTPTTTHHAPTSTKEENMNYLTQLDKELHNPHNRDYDFVTHFELPESDSPQEIKEQNHIMLGESRQLINTGTQEDHISYRTYDSIHLAEGFITEWFLEHNFTCKAIDKENAQLINNRAPHLYVKDHTLIHVFYKYLPRHPSDNHKAPPGGNIIRLMAVQYHNVTQHFDNCANDFRNLDPHLVR